MNDPYPGQCGRYIDKNGDQICDRSQELDAAGELNESAKTTSFKEEVVDVDSLAVVGRGAEIEKPRRSKVAVAVIAIGLTVTYFLSLLLVKLGRVNTFHNRRFWNFLLLIAFLVLTVTSVVLVLSAVYGMVFTGYQNWINLHTMSGVAMLLISLFHTFWHGGYWKRYFCKKENDFQKLFKEERGLNYFSGNLDKLNAR